MATVKKTMKKAQSGIVKSKVAPKKEEMVPSEMFPGKMIPKSKSNYYNGAYNKMVETGRLRTEAARKAFDAKAKAKPKLKAGGAVKKAKSGSSFPDLNKDGKITKADILKGRGVIAKKGASVSKKCKYGCK
jgi:hypothetical protein